MSTDVTSISAIRGHLRRSMGRLTPTSSPQLIRSLFSAREDMLILEGKTIHLHLGRQIIRAQFCVRNDMLTSSASEGKIDYVHKFGPVSCFTLYLV